MASINSIIGKTVQSGLDPTTLKSSISAAVEITPHTNVSRAIADITRSIRAGQNYLIIAIEQ